MLARISVVAALITYGATDWFGQEVAAEGPILRGQIVDESGHPISGARVVLYGGIATRFRGQEAITDANGQYRFDPLKTGALMKRDQGGGQFYTGVKVEHRDYVPADGKSWRDIEVPTVDRHEQVLDITMTRGGKLGGIIVDAETQKPVPDLDLRILNGFLDGEENGSFLAYSKTDKSGKFESGPLVPGRYIIEINDNDFQHKFRYPKIGKAEVAAGKTADVQLTTRERPDLQDPFQITGTATAADGKSMVYGAVSVRIIGGKEKLRSRGGGIDGRNQFGLHFGPVMRSEPTDRAHFGIGTHEIELVAGNQRYGYTLVSRTPSEPLRITDDPHRPELENGIRYIQPNRPMKFELVFAKKDSERRLSFFDITRVARRFAAQ